MKWKFWAAIIACAQLAFVGARCLSTGTLHAQLSHLHSLSFIQDYYYYDARIINWLNPFGMPFLFRRFARPAFLVSRVKVSNIDISLPKGASNLDGFTIALLTDVHIGPTVGKQRLQNIVNIVNGLDADVIAIVGDLIDGFLGNLGEKALILKKLKSRHGTFFVTGNHEYYHSSIDEWISFFKHKLNMTILRNENFLINQNICLAGVDDVVTQRLFIDGHRMDAEKAIQNCPAKSYVVMMVHQPNAARKILDMSSRHINLILSGHTHGGQFYIFWPISYLYHAFLHGHYKYGKLGTDIVVSAGVNYWGPPAKMRNLCEIVRIKLVSNV
uniref:Calcineurin-like phosphoesterase domain-containing protein n=1 Tax=Ditylenchus dipsaci TaxID=166011 RepID=A0A915D9J1_9BILA